MSLAHLSNLQNILIYPNNVLAWEPVRNILVSKFLKWDREQDKFEGTEEYGDRNNEETSWAIPFTTLNFTHYKVESIDQNYSKEYLREELEGKFD